MTSPDVHPLKSFCAGGAGGMCLVLVGHPLDTIKVRLQTMPNPAPGKEPLYTGTLDCAKKIYQKESLKGFFKGMATPLAGVAPMYAICFLGMNFGTKMFVQDQNNPKYHEIFLSGMLAGLSTTPIIAPGERIKCILQIQGLSNEKPKYKGPNDLIKQLYKEGGLRSIFKGSSATILRDVPASGTYFLTYETLKTYFKNQSQDGKMSVGATLLSGGLAGTLNWLVALPIDTLKSRLQIAPEGRYPKGIRSVFSELVAKEGIGALYRGINPVLIRAFPANAACFLGYESAMKFMNYLLPNL